MSLIELKPDRTPALEKGSSRALLYFLWYQARQARFEHDQMMVGVSQHFQADPQIAFEAWMEAGFVTRDRRGVPAPFFRKDEDGLYLNDCVSAAYRGWSKESTDESWSPYMKRNWRYTLKPLIPRVLGLWTTASIFGVATLAAADSRASTMQTVLWACLAIGAGLTSLYLVHRLSFVKAWFIEQQGDE